MAGPSSRRAFFKSGAVAGAPAIPGLERRCGYKRGGSRLFVKIHTNQDIWGCGEGVDATPAEARETVHVRPPASATVRKRRFPHSTT